MLAVALVLASGSGAGAWAYRRTTAPTARTPVYVPSVDAPPAAVPEIAVSSPTPLSSAASASVQPKPPLTSTSPPPSIAAKGNPARANLALTGTTTASSIESDPWQARYATDGDPATRWSSGFADPQWIRVDLHERRQLSEVTLVWEHAYGTRYRVDTSLDGRTWRTLWSTTAGRGGTVVVDGKGAVARYVRMVGVRRVSSYGYSLLELEIR